MFSASSTGKLLPLGVSKIKGSLESLKRTIVRASEIFNPSSEVLAFNAEATHTPYVVCKIDGLLRARCYLLSSNQPSLLL